MDPEEYIKDSWDIHVHAAPSLFPRWGDAIDLARICSENAMAGFVLKYHHGSSVEAASIANKDFNSLKIFGGITLNYPVGGLNPHAADTAITLGAKVIWLPTIHAANHERKMGVLGGFHFQKSNVSLDVKKGLTIYDKNGDICQSLKIILDLVNNSPVILATGHISADEIYSLKSYIKCENLKIRLLVNHALFKTTELDERQISELSDRMTWFETVYLTVSPVANAVPVKKVAGIIGNTTESQWIIASDTGQLNNIKSPAALAAYARMLGDEGIDKNRIFRMLKEEPKSLLNI